MPAYRDDLEALSLRHSALATEVAAKTRELSAASELLADAKARARLPVLDNIRVATPCSADWAQMTGSERIRACGDCKKNVYNLSDMTRDEAQALIIEKEGKLCVRYFQRKDGTILLKDCVIGVKRKRRRRLFAVGAAALLAGGAGLVYRSMTGTDPLQQTVGAMELPVERLRVPVETPDVQEIKGEVTEGPNDNLVEVLGGIGPEPSLPATTHRQRVRK